MKFNPNALWISPSSIGDFSKCAQLYYYRSLYRNPKTGLKIQLLNGPLALGQVVHDCLDKFSSKEPKERQEKACWELFENIWKQVCCDEEIFKSKVEENESKERGKAMVGRFLKNDHFKTAQKVAFPDFPKADLGDEIILTGKLDWIEKEGQDYRIIDFKTGKNEERDDSIQLPIYAYLVSKVLDIPIGKIKVQYWYLDKDGDWVDFPLPDMNEFALSLKQVGMRMKMVRDTKSFRCSRGTETCWACKDMYEIVQGRGKLIFVDAVGRKQETYILPQSIKSDLPF